MPYRCSRALLLILTTVFSHMTFAEPRVGQPLPPITIEKYGELVMDTEHDEVVYAPWDSQQSFTTLPVMHAVLYLPASFNAQSSNVPYTKKLDELDIQGYRGYIRPTTILNIDEDGWGGAAIVLGPIKYNKRKYPDSVMVADSEGQAHAAWQLGNDIVIMVVDQHGIVQFYGEGELTPDQVEEVGRLLSEGADAIMHPTADSPEKQAADAKEKEEEPATPIPVSTVPLSTDRGGEAS